MPNDGSTATLASSTSCGTPMYRGENGSVWTTCLDHADLYDVLPEGREGIPVSVQDGEVRLDGLRVEEYWRRH